MFLHETPQEKSYAGNLDLNLSTSATFLGLVVGSTLRWKEHWLSSSCFSASVIARVANLETLEAVYYGYVYSHIIRQGTEWCLGELWQVFLNYKWIIRIMLNRNCR